MEKVTTITTNTPIVILCIVILYCVLIRTSNEKNFPIFYSISFPWPLLPFAVVRAAVIEAGSRQTPHYLWKKLTGQGLKCKSRVDYAATLHQTILIVPLRRGIWKWKHNCPQYFLRMHAKRVQRSPHRLCLRKFEDREGPQVVACCL